MIVKSKYKQLTFEGISEGGIRTSIVIPQMDLMMDAGFLDEDRVNIPNLVLTHAHLDHSAGLPYYVSQRSLRGLSPPNLYIPEHLEEPMRQILNIYSKIEDFSYNYTLNKVIENELYYLNRNYYFKALKTFHRVPSFGYTVYEKINKLKPEYSHLEGPEIAKRRSEGENLTDEKMVPTVSFSGDTTIEYITQHRDVRESKVLFLECTYIDSDRSVERTREWGHIHLDEIISNADLFQNEKIFLIHFSKRYTYKYIKDTVEAKLPESLKNRVECFLPRGGRE